MSGSHDATPFHLIGSLCSIAVAVGLVLWAPAASLLPALAVVVLGYVFFGHRLLGAALTRLFKGPGFSHEDIRSGYEQKVTRLLKKQKIEEAEKQTRFWIRHEPESSVPHIHLSAILRQKGDLQGAIQHLQIAAARRFTPEQHVNLALALADLYRQAGRESEIDPLFKRVRSLHSGSPHVQKLG